MSTLFPQLRLRSIQACLGAAAALMLAGCYSYPTYSPYGYGQPYGTGGYPPTMAPGQLQPMPDPNMGQPNLGAPTGTPGAYMAPVSPTAPGAANYPPSGGAGGNLVPNYTEPTSQNTTPFGSSASSATLLNARVQPTEAEPEEAITPTNFNAETTEPEPAEAPDSDETTTIRSTDPIEPEVSEPAEIDFQQPIQMPDQSSTGTTKDKLAATGPKPTDCDYDKERLAWMRGVVDYDKKDKSWNIIYSMEPKKDDKLGGSVTLADVDRFPGIHDGDMVLVQGKIDSNSRDRTGKSLYRVEKLQRL